MPTLQFKGKNTIWNHHLSIPYHTLDEINDLDYKPKDGEGNLIIEGDNLIALKALLPNYRNKIKCIYIDPPYNTGNENWVYNDNVNNTLMKDWLGKVVGKDDLTKHDKWLCMMVPRLKLLRELLSKNGVILISINDKELPNLISIMNEVFLEQNFATNFVWRKKAGGGNDSDAIAIEHEYIVCYSLGDSSIHKIEQDEKSLKKYNGEDEKILTHGKFNLKNLNDRSLNDSSGLHYDIETPDGTILSGEKNQWKCIEKTFFQRLNDNRIVFKKQKNIWNVYYKIYLNEEKGELRTDEKGNIIQKGRNVSSILYNVALNKDGNDELKFLFDKEKFFDYPKPSTLVKYFLNFCSTKDDIILDSFAGSGTTAQAVMELNAEDGGNRKFILIQMKEETKDEPNKNICKDITRERVKRAIDKYKYKSGFKYLRVGIPIDAETMLAGNLPDYKQLAKFVYYLCTGENLKETNEINEKNYFVGNFGSSAIYLIYKKDFESLKNLALTLELAEKFKKENKKKRLIVYAPACFLDEEYLTENQISFVGIPYNLFEKT